MNKKDNGEDKTKKGLVFSNLASKITNIDGKMIGKDGKPLRAVRCVVLQEPIFVVEVSKADQACVQNVSNTPSHPVVDKNVEQIIEDVSINGDVSDAMRSDCNNDGSSGEAANVDKNAASGNVNGISSFASLVRPNSANSKVNSVNGISQRKEGSFASLLRPKEVTNKLRFRTLVNKEKVECSDCVLPKVAANLVKSRYENSIVGFFVGKSPSFPIQFCHALIEISSASTLKKEVIMAIPEEEGDGHIKEVIRVEYEWKPPHCVECKSFGHSHDLCPKRVRDDFLRLQLCRRNQIQSPIGSQKKSVDSKNMTTPLSNSFDVLNTAEKEDVQNPKVSDHAGTSSSNLHVNKDQEESLWSRFNKGKENAKSKSSELEDESDDDEVYMPHGGGFTDGMEDDLECYDGYGTHVYDLTPQEQAFCDQYDIRLNSHGRK
ncbi:hypothetical protein Tco_0490236 [Tanacetum coccineum]